MCFLHRCVVSSVRGNFFLILGLFLGVALSSFISEIVRNRCVFTSGHFSSDVKNSHVSSDDRDDYEPVINLAGKPLKAQKTPKDFQRPRYYRTELGIRDKLLAAILTSPKTLRDYGMTLNTTISHLFDKTVFFTESEQNKSKGDFRWNGVVKFSDSRAVLKPFHMLKYIIDNYLDEFDYFFLVRDKTYIRGRELYNLVKKISVSETVHAGSGQDVSTNRYCSLNSGILVSNVVLRKISLKLDWCIKNAFLDSDDANVGRCIVYSSGVGCTSSVQGLTLSSYVLDPNLKEIEVGKMERNKAFNQALTFWPVSSHTMLLKLHAYFAKVEILQRKKEISLIRQKIIEEPVILPDNTTLKITWPIGTPPPVKPNNRFDVLRWDYFTEKQIFLKTDFDNVNDLSGADLLDVQYVIKTGVSFIENKYGNQYKYKRLVNGYRRFDPSRGMDYILDVDLEDTKTGEEVEKRLELCKPLSKAELIPMPYVTENTRVNMILPVDEGNREEVLKFMESYVSVCMERKDKTYLMLVLVYGAQHPGKGSKDDIYSEVKKAALKHSDRFKRDNNKIAWLSVKLPDEGIINPVIFADERAIGLNPGILKIIVLDLAVKKFTYDNLILLCTSNMELRQDYLNRVRMNTIKENQVFSPIPFTEFDPDIVYNEEMPRPKDMDINRNYGHYDTLNKDHIGFYVRDYREARKTVEEYIPTVHTDRDITDLVFHLKKKVVKVGRTVIGSPFVEQMKKLSTESVFSVFVEYGKLHVFRAVEPGLRLRHVSLDCTRILQAQRDLLASSLHDKCIQERNFNSGTRSQLGHFILEYMRGCGSSKNDKM